jgi:ATP-dependent RNA helicase SUPV3L1/SUV3
MRAQANQPHSRLVALLGPTNTGKTHRAIQRMLEHPSGMLGLPLRLLAREVYDRLTRELGEQQVALVTGEEKRTGRTARYWICTVEAMPLTQEVDFLAVDEIQLCAHPRRGHIFTDRLLHARGRVETWFLGAGTMRSLVSKLLPTASIETQPRLSRLEARGQSSLGSLPARSALVAFSVPEVYSLAERVRQRRGGAAVVLGAFSPRVRNAQVALYEAREVDYLVATDAIGMGLNLGIRHVAFASVRKFDGRDERPLSAAELAQVAGRAGRHLENGSFGTLSPLPALPAGLQRNIAEHRFESVQYLGWRNSDLSLESVRELLDSLHAPPRAHSGARDALRRLAPASDLEALERLAEDAEVKSRARGAAQVELLWQACQIPNYRRWLPELHAELVKQVFVQLSGSRAELDADWLAASLRPLDDSAGDIDALGARISSLRTWSYLAQQAWTPDVAHWIGRTHEIENRLSDALHERLVERFVARKRLSVQLSAPDLASSAAHGSPADDSRNPFHVLGSLREQLLDGPAPISLERWVEDLAAAAHERFEFDAAGNVFDGQGSSLGRQGDAARLARLIRGAGLLRPELKLSIDGLSAGQQLRLSRRLLAWSRDLIGEITGALRDEPDPPWSAAGRGLCYELAQQLGSLPVKSALIRLDELTDSDRRSLSARGIRIGREAVFSRDSLELRQRWARQALARAFAPRDLSSLPPLQDALSFVVPASFDAHWLGWLGFVVLGGRAVRADVLDRVSQRARRRARSGPFTLDSELLDGLAGDVQALAGVLQALGYRQGSDGAYRRVRRRRRNARVT